MSKFKFNSDGWTNWITHDGSGCPCVGYYVKVEHMHPSGRLAVDEGRAAQKKSWDWTYFPVYTKVIRYRVRKPLGMKQVEGLLENLPESIEEKV